MKETRSVTAIACHDYPAPELGRPDSDVSAQVSVKFDVAASVESIVSAIHYAAAQAVLKAIEARPETDNS